MAGTIHGLASWIVSPECKNLVWKTHPPGQPPSRSSDTSGLSVVLRWGRFVWPLADSMATLTQKLVAAADCKPTSEIVPSPSLARPHNGPSSPPPALGPFLCVVQW